MLDLDVLSHFFQSLPHAVKVYEILLLRVIKLP